MDERERLRRKWFTPEELEEMRQADVEIEREFEQDPQAFTSSNGPKFVYTYEGVERQKPEVIDREHYDLYEDGRLVLEDVKKVEIASYLNVSRMTIVRYVRGDRKLPTGIRIVKHESD